MVNNSDSSTRPEVRWYFWDCGILAVGFGNLTATTHSHHAFQLFVSAEGVGRVRHGDDQWIETPSCAIAPDEFHSFAADGKVQATVYVDPECFEGYSLRRSLSAPLSFLSEARLSLGQDAVRAFWDDPPDENGTRAFIDTMIRLFVTGPMAPRVGLDPRVARAIQYIRGSDASRVRLEDVAAEVFLSRSRFSHLFRAEVGISFRRYIAWRRLTRALLFLTQGHTLSSAAHFAGFSDPGHFTRTFCQMFGAPPSRVFGPATDLREIPPRFELSDLPGS